MKYTCTTIINLPIEKVVEVWANEEYFDQWQEGFESIELLDGEKDSVGAKSKIILQQGKRTVELIETILINNLPHEKKALYEHTHMSNTQSSRFESIANNRTRYTSEMEYIRFSGIIPKVIARLLPAMFERQSQRWMDQFKEFVEGTE